MSPVQEKNFGRVKDSSLNIDGDDGLVMVDLFLFPPHQIDELQEKRGPTRRDGGHRRWSI
jgi:hypothetical protein